MGVSFTSCVERHVALCGAPGLPRQKPRNGAPEVARPNNHDSVLGALCCGDPSDEDGQQERQQQEPQPLVQPESRHDEERTSLWELSVGEGHGARRSRERTLRASPGAMRALRQCQALFWGGLVNPKQSRQEGPWRGRSNPVTSASGGLLLPRRGSDACQEGPPGPRLSSVPSFSLVSDT